ncbi:MAG TPA: PP2C family protein-serine/threonine phosphatase [Marmoricola sp.]|nr:PP2C family protein-serine/threonine phosphatase [Marmoricola sp.]
MADLHRALGTPASTLSTLILRVRRQVVFSDRPALIALSALAIGLTAVGLADPDLVPQTALLLPMFLGSLWLWPRSLPWFVVFCLCGVIVLVATQETVNERSVMRVVTVFVIALVIMLTSFRRNTLGVSGPRGESMLVDLRDRIQHQGRIPALPPEWDITSAMKTAGGTRFAGDFVGASLCDDGARLEVMVVDVSGKGVEAGTRALLLSGAFGGLASALPPERFLPEANKYLLKQEWGEGFASAVHLSLHLTTGDFEIRSAGHPPPVWLHAGSGEWSVLECDGAVLGLMPDVQFEVVRGRLDADDALVLYTDGLVETTDRDLSSGIDKLAGRSQLLFTKGFENGARRLIDDLATHGDDGAVVLVHRRWR